MKYLIDTCVLSDFVKGNLNTIRKITEIDPIDLAISAITIMEIQYGILLVPGQKSTSIKNIIDELVKTINVIVLDKEVALQASSIRAKLHNAGTPIGSYDVLIAATAKHHNLIMVTANTKEFERISDLRVQNWR